MALPTSRSENCVAGAKVASALLNDIQDNIIAINGGRHAEFVLPVPLSPVYAESGSVATERPHEIVINATATLVWPIFPAVGKRLKRAELAILAKSAGGNLTFEVKRILRGSTGTNTWTIGTSVGSVVVTAAGDAIISGLSHTVVADEHYGLVVSAPNETITFGWLEITLDKP